MASTKYTWSDAAAKRILDALGVTGEEIMAKGPPYLHLGNVTKALTDEGFDSLSKSDAFCSALHARSPATLVQFVSRCMRDLIETRRLIKRAEDARAVLLDLHDIVKLPEEEE